jgi:alkyldihydroxyacetonephosphate synthase
VYGPQLERQLKAHGLTLRHFPQSFEFSTVGGWVATRGGGHFATGPTHIDEVVESVRLVTPSGVTVETRQLPASGAGPAEHRLYIGSEGTLGIITEVCLRLRRIPTRRSQATVLFRAETDDAAFLKGARAVQYISQTGLQPANLRLVYGQEMDRITQAGGLDNAAALLVGFEAANDTLDLSHQMAATLQICSDFGGDVLKDSDMQSNQGSARSNLASKWGSGFMRGGYTFSAAVLAGAVLNTFETAVTWDRFFDGFHKAVLEATRNAIREHCGAGTVTCRFTHIYPDGPAPYYTILAEGRMHPVDIRAEQWRHVKKAAMDAVMRWGGTCTHHHSVGKLHRPQYHMELGALFSSSLEAVKRVHDPAWVLNPGVLLEVPQKARL